MSSGDKLIIETPEQTVLEFPLAGIGSRSLALVIDTLLQIAVLIVLGLLGAIISSGAYLPRFGKQYVYAILIFIAFLTQFGYFAFFEAIWNGRTPGKRWIHLRVIMDSGRPLGAQGAILRNLMRIVDEIPFPMYAVGIITSLISPQNKRVGDYLAGTVVIQEKSVQGDRSLWDATPTTLLATSQFPKLNAAELQLVEAYLDRRSSLQDDVRRMMARQIAERMTQGSAGIQETIQDPEKFLEALAEHSRNMVHFR
ncbi:MAG: putative rane protein/domain protein [Candidatus Acidoferrum typicum]|nr:putative rane protein/domain protein [Candidatus Acidoferrum typicum]